MTASAFANLPFDCKRKSRVLRGDLLLEQLALCAHVLSENAALFGGERAPRPHTRTRADFVEPTRHVRLVFKRLLLPRPKRRPTPQRHVSNGIKRAGDIAIVRQPPAEHAVKPTRFIAVFGPTRGRTSENDAPIPPQHRTRPSATSAIRSRRFFRARSARQSARFSLPDTAGSRPIQRWRSARRPGHPARRWRHPVN